MYRYELAIMRSKVVIIPVIIFILFTAVTITVIPAYSADESIEVTCFKGNQQEGNTVGNVTVTNPADAGQTCNSTYYDCDGKCVGCYYDQNLGKTVCYDSTGGTVAK